MPGSGLSLGSGRKASAGRALTQYDRTLNWLRRTSQTLVLAHRYALFWVRTPGMLLTEVAQYAFYGFFFGAVFFRWVGGSFWTDAAGKVSAVPCAAWSHLLQIRARYVR